MYFQLKTTSVGVTEVLVVLMAIYTYFTQWIIKRSYYQKGYISYWNNYVYIKITCI